jgi:hypothetical protein
MDERNEVGVRDIKKEGPRKNGSKKSNIEEREEIIK